MNTMRTLSQVMGILIARGYTKDFQLDGDGIICADGTSYSSNQFYIDKTYRFEGMSDPGDNAILYAISDENKNPKGLLVDAYGVYANPISENLKKKLTEAEKHINSTADNEE